MHVTLVNVHVKPDHVDDFIHKPVGADESRELRQAWGGGHEGLGDLVTSFRCID